MFNVIVYNGIVIELLYLLFYVGVDYVFVGINMIVLFEFEFLLGNVVFIFGVLDGVDFVFDIRCEFILGDWIDKVIYVRLKNFIDGDLIIYNY